jgi:hypothetical protein
VLDCTDNWDGYGSPRPSLEAVKVADSVLKAIGESADGDMPIPHVAGTADGNVLIEFDGRDTEMLFEVDARNIDVFISHRGESWEGPYHASPPDLLRRALVSLFTT